MHRPSRYARRWADLWATLTPQQSRTLDQILIGRSILGIEPDRAYAEAVADLVAERIDNEEFFVRLTRDSANEQATT